MCIFSQDVEEVSGTKIFCRNVSDGCQALVYSMSYIASAEVAMILPLPIAPDCGEDAVRFIDLKGYSDFFTDLESAFPILELPQTIKPLFPFSCESDDMLQVHVVGDYIASFVPSIRDFSRLDPKFRLPSVALDHVPIYKEYGFAVFQLKASSRVEHEKTETWDDDDVLRMRITEDTRDDDQFLDTIERDIGSPVVDVHPMAFAFPQRNPGLLFFPTVHVHDGLFSDKANFDHTLYCQPDEIPLEYLTGWQQSERNASNYCRKDAFESGIVDPDKPIYRLGLYGKRENKDLLVGNNRPR